MFQNIGFKQNCFKGLIFTSNGKRKHSNKNFPVHSSDGSQPFDSIFRTLIHFRRVILPYVRICSINVWTFNLFLFKRFPRLCRSTFSIINLTSAMDCHLRWRIKSSVHNY
ncbi:MAG: hypothetical protein ACTS5A_00980 [Candidatus Hodgkinia cicadicola]